MEISAREVEDEGNKRTTGGKGVKIEREGNEWKNSYVPRFEDC